MMTQPRGRVWRAGLAWIALGAGLLLAQSNPPAAETSGLRHPDERHPSTQLRVPEERHLKNIRQLTFGGENAEAYFSPDGRWLIFQSHEGPDTCDQIYVMDLEGGSRRRVSTGRGRTTCGFFFPDGKRILYSSTHHVDPNCPPPPDYTRGYVWQVHPTYDIFTARPGGGDLKQLTATPGYDAETTIAADGRIVFTSTRDADLEIYTMNPDGSEVRRLTHRPGYDGGAVFSPDGRQIVWRAQYPTSPEEIADYQALLKDGLVRPGRLELWVMDSDPSTSLEASGSNQRQLTSNGAANFGPAFHPDGKRIIFASNLHDPKSRPPAKRGGAGNFDLYLINLDGTGLERVTHHELFDAFPMFSPDGKKLVWASNRPSGAPRAHNQSRSAGRGETNIFLADWVE